MPPRGGLSGWATNQAPSHTATQILYKLPCDRKTLVTLVLRLSFVYSENYSLFLLACHELAS